MFKSFRYLLLALSFIALNSLNAMEISDKSNNNSILKLITPYSSSPIPFIPKYVYENCNQITRMSWSDDQFESLKSSVENLTKETVRIRFANDKEYIPYAELVDWVYGLNYLYDTHIKTGKYLASSLTVDDVRIINGKFCRLVADNPGEFRKKDIQWRKRSFTAAEDTLYEFIAQMTLEDFLSGNNDFGIRLDPISPEINSNAIRRLLVYYKKNPQLLAGEHCSNIDEKEVGQWLAEQGKKKGSLNLKLWENARIHFFPEAECIESEVNKALLTIQDPLMHPIEKAARIWWEIIRIHISHEANKRTGKALASIILLQNGYLPPLITKEYEKKYVDTLIQGFSKSQEEGFKDFLNFVIAMIMRTQFLFKNGSEKLV